MIKNIVFDMGGVLINLDKNRCIAAFNKIGFNDVELYIDKYIQNGLFLSYENNTTKTDNNPTKSNNNPSLKFSIH